MRIASLCYLFFVVVFLSGCSSAPDRQIPVVELIAADSPADTGPSLSYSIQAFKDADGTDEASAALASQVKLELLEVLQLSNRFSSVKENDAVADIKLRLTYKEYSNPGARLSGFVTAISLSLIPSKETVTIEVSASAATPVNSQSYELNDSATQKRGLPVVSESAIVESLAAKPQIRKNLFRALVNRMIEDGFFTAE